MNYLLFITCYFFVSLFDHPFLTRWERTQNAVTENVTTVSALAAIDEYLAATNESIHKITSKDYQSNKFVMANLRSLKDRKVSLETFKLMYMHRTSTDLVGAVKHLAKNMIAVNTETKVLNDTARTLAVGQLLDSFNMPIADSTIAACLSLIDKATPLVDLSQEDIAKAVADAHPPQIPQFLQPPQPQSSTYQEQQPSASAFYQHHDDRKHRRRRHNNKEEPDVDGRDHHRDSKQRHKHSHKHSYHPAYIIDENEIINAVVPTMQYNDSEIILPSPHQPQSRQLQQRDAQMSWIGGNSERVQQSQFLSNGGGSIISPPERNSAMLDLQRIEEETSHVQHDQNLTDSTMPVVLLQSSTT